MLSLRNSWFMKTLTGYTVTFITLSTQYTVVHRPFRKPEMAKGYTGAMRGRKYETIYFDEVTSISPENLRKIDAIMKGNIIK